MLRISIESPFSSAIPRFVLLLVLKLCYLAASRSGQRDHGGERVMSDEHQLIFAK